MNAKKEMKAVDRASALEKRTNTGGSMPILTRRIAIAIVACGCVLSTGSPVIAFHEYENCKRVQVPLPKVEGPLALFDSCDEEGPPKFNNYCCEGWFDCHAGHCCGCEDFTAP